MAAAIEKWLVLADGTRHRLADLSYEEFCVLGRFSGSSDTGYDSYLRRYGMVNVEDFNQDTLLQARIELVADGEYVTLTHVPIYLDFDGQEYDPEKD